MAQQDPKVKAAKATIPEGFGWDYPQWVRTDRFKALDLKFIARILVGGFLGLLFGRVLGSLQGLFLQWVYEGIVRAAPATEASVGRFFHLVATALGAVFSPLLAHSPLEVSVAEARASGSGTASLLFLAQLHGSLNGLYQGLKPALGDRCQGILDRALLSWGLLWRGIAWPVRALCVRPPSEEKLYALLRDAESPSASRALRRLVQRGVLPGQAIAGGEAGALAAWPGRIPPQKRREMWWTTPSLRIEVYRWLESASPAQGLSLLARGLHDPDEDARLAALKALAAQGTPASVPYLIAALQEESPARAIAVQGLRRCADAMKKSQASPEESSGPPAGRSQEKGST